MNDEKFDLDRILDLAKIEVSESKVETLRDDLDNMLNYFDALNDVEEVLAAPELFESTKPLLSPMEGLMGEDNQDQFREDILQANESKIIKKDEILEQAPGLQGNLFKVPPVL